MTPKTQSVCVCPGKKHPVRIYCLICLLPYEPISEPASTGEPPEKFKVCCADAEITVTDEKVQVSCPHGSASLYLAARPSEPSAPPEWRRQESCSECDGDGCAKCAPQTSTIIGKGYVELDQMIENAAPQTSAEPSITSSVGMMLSLERYNELSETERQIKCLKNPPPALLQVVSKYLEHGLTRSHAESAVILCDLLSKFAEARYVQPAAPQPVSGDAPTKNRAHFSLSPVKTHVMLGVEETTMIATVIANEFSNQLRRSLTAEVLAEVVKLNNAETDKKGICHTHDFCDANMEMIAALETLGIIKISDALWNEAWSIAKGGGFNPSPSTGDAPKVEEIAGKLYGKLAYVDIGMEDWFQKAVAILRPYFPPASQTPEGYWPVNVSAETEQSLKKLLDRNRDGSEEYKVCAQLLGDIHYSNVATPASTARTDGASELLEVLGAIEGVSGDDFCADLEMRNANRKLHGALATAYEKLGQIYRLSHGFNTQNSCHHVHTNWREELKKFAAPGSVPQAQWTGVNDGSGQYDFPRTLSVKVTGDTNKVNRDEDK